MTLRDEICMQCTAPNHLLRVLRSTLNSYNGTAYKLVLALAWLAAVPASKPGKLSKT